MFLALPLALLTALIARIRRRRDGARVGRGCRWFWAWAVVGAVVSFTFLAGFSIGPLILPVALVLLLAVAWSSPQWGESTGFLAGLAGMLLLVAMINRGYHPCPANGISIGPAMPGQSVSCGGLDPRPWLLAGLALALGSLAAFSVVLSKRR